MSLVPLKEREDRLVYLNPDYIVSVQFHGEGAAVWMTGDADPFVVKNTPEEVYGLILYYSEEWEEEDDE